MIDDSFNFSKELDVSSIRNYDSISRKIIWYIYAVRNYLSEKDSKEMSSLMCNRKIIEYISRYNFVPLRKNVNFKKLLEGETVGFLLNLEIIYTSGISDDELVFNSKNEYNIITVKIKF